MTRKLFDSLNEKQQRLYLGELAAEYGKGGIAKVAAEYGASRERVAKGMREYNAGESYRQGEAVRRAGGGRKKKTEIYPNLEKRVLELVEANDGTYGAPTDDRKWTALSQRKLSRILKEEGMDVSAGTVASILKKNRYSRQQNRKMKEASEPGPHRDEQFAIISRKAEEFENAGEPVVSIDAKKKKS
jgi:hypothetical protein